jgi:hypothetical protein
VTVDWYRKYTGDSPTDSLARGTQLSVLHSFRVEFMEVGMLSAEEISIISAIINPNVIKIGYTMEYNTADWECVYDDRGKLIDINVGKQYKGKFKTSSLHSGECEITGLSDCADKTICNL